jgi:hypothetical protein
MGLQMNLLWLRRLSAAISSAKACRQMVEGFNTGVRVERRREYCVAGVIACGRYVEQQEVIARARSST